MYAFHLAHGEYDYTRSAGGGGDCKKFWKGMDLRRFWHRRCFYRKFLQNIEIFGFKHFLKAYFDTRHKISFWNPALTKTMRMYWGFRRFLSTKSQCISYLKILKVWMNNNIGMWELSLKKLISCSHSFNQYSLSCFRLA